MKKLTGRFAHNSIGHVLKMNFDAEIYERAVKNIRKEYGNKASAKLREETPSMQMALLQGFNWTNSNEGWNFWEEIFNQVHFTWHI